MPIALSSQRGLSDTNEHCGDQRTGDVEEPTEANQARPVLSSINSELDAVGLYPRILLVGLLTHFECMRFPRSAQ